MTSAIDVVMVNYRTPDDALRFIDSVPEAAGGLIYDFYVANVDPTDEDFVRLSHAPHRYHHVVYEDNVGYAVAVNSCSSRGYAPYIGIFNADVVLSPDSLAEAVKVMDENPDWGVLGPRQINSEGRITHAGIFGTQAQPQHRGWRSIDKPEYADVREAVTLSGAALIVRRSCWEEMMGCHIFSQCFPAALGAFILTPHYYEETGFIYHAVHHGWKAMYYGPIRVVHEWHRASPVGGWAEKQMKFSQGIFRNFMDRHGIPHD